MNRQYDAFHGSCTVPDLGQTVCLPKRISVKETLCKQNLPSLPKVLIQHTRSVVYKGMLGTMGDTKMI